MKKRKNNIKKYKNQRGSMSIEAAIVLPVVMVLLACSLLSYRFIAVIEKNEFESLKIERFSWHLRYTDREVPKELNYAISGGQILNSVINDDSIFKVQYRYMTSRWYKTEELHTVSTYKNNILGPKKWTFIIPVYTSMGDGIDFIEETVFITDTGSKYHLSNCYHLRKSKHAISIKEAEERKYKPCKHCVDKKSTSKKNGKNINKAKNKKP